MGPELMEQMREQAKAVRCRAARRGRRAVDLPGPVKTVSANGQTYRARAVILAWRGGPHLVSRGNRSCSAGASVPVHL